MKPLSIGLAVLAVFSAVMLTHKWLSMYNMENYTVVFYAGVFVAAITALIILCSEN